MVSVDVRLDPVQGLKIHLLPGNFRNLKSPVIARDHFRHSKDQVAALLPARNVHDLAFGRCPSLALENHHLQRDGGYYANPRLVVGTHRRQSHLPANFCMVRNQRLVCSGRR
jgi:hypothetical protein